MTAAVSAPVFKIPMPTVFQSDPLMTAAVPVPVFKIPMPTMFQYSRPAGRCPQAAVRRPLSAGRCPALTGTPPHAIGPLLPFRGRCLLPAAPFAVPWSMPSTRRAEFCRVRLLQAVRFLSSPSSHPVRFILHLCRLPSGRSSVRFLPAASSAVPAATFKLFDSSFKPPVRLQAFPAVTFKPPPTVPAATFKPPVRLLQAVPAVTFKPPVRLLQALPPPPQLLQAARSLQAVPWYRGRSCSVAPRSVRLPAIPLSLPPLAVSSFLPFIPLFSSSVSRTPPPRSPQSCVFSVSLPTPHPGTRTAQFHLLAPPPGSFTSLTNGVLFLSNGVLPRHPP